MTWTYLCEVQPKRLLYYIHQHQQSHTILLRWKCVSSVCKGLSIYFDPEVVLKLLISCTIWVFPATAVSVHTHTHLNMTLWLNRFISKYVHDCCKCSALIGGCLFWHCAFIGELKLVTGSGSSGN